MDSKKYDIAIIGGGIVGCATAMALVKTRKVSLIILEAESSLAAHQTGNNSGVIHSGLYYKPGSMKAKNCVEGREKLYQFCAEHGIAHERCGKLVVATSEDDIPAMDDLERRGTANGLKDITQLTAEELKVYEPHVRGVRGLRIHETGIVDYVEVTNKFADIVQENGEEIRKNARVIGFERENGGLVLETTDGTIHCKNLVNCAGLQSDRIAKMCGVEPGLKIVPFRGEYYKLKPEKEFLVKDLIYPVPDPQFPFLGVHFTRMIHGGVEAGPNAVLAFKREGYKKTDISLKDSLDTFTYKGFWLLAGKFLVTGLGEMYRSYFKGAFVRALQNLVPEIEKDALSQGGAGVRAQALEPNGALVDDFRIVEAQNMVHVLNAPSPAATASISIGEKISEMVAKSFQLS
jgi:L-2-hydroxyglutarate oxidase